MIEVKAGLRTHKTKFIAFPVLTSGYVDKLFLTYRCGGSVRFALTSRLKNNFEIILT